MSSYSLTQFLSFSIYLGSSVNIPWPEKGMGDAEYIYAFQKVVMPIAMEFAPELVISTLNGLPLPPALMSRHM